MRRLGQHFLADPKLLAKIVAIGVSFLVNFTLTHLVVFGTKRAAND